MKMITKSAVRLILSAVLFTSSASLFTSCASDKVQQRVDRRSDGLEHIGNNMEIRRQARDERYERQWDRIMN
ncbi:MAG: hypothetical protein KDM64_06150 [Verrucomicrobiae bacterium]|nr:hypothetical protein [Verrucomicrobiae bacterium]